jgi:predicted dinucleotide-binding enzyme
MSTISILGTGRVGSILATGLAAAGHRVLVGTRTPPPHGVAGALETVDLSTAAATASVVINATPGDTSVATLSGLRTELEGKILIDLSNTTTRTSDGRPGAQALDGSSIGERLQAALPDTRVVKSLNTMMFTVMTAPGSLTAPPTAFVSGDDAGAKATVTALLRDLGWDAEWIVDLGGIETAGGPEAMAVIVPSLIAVFGFTPFALGVTR